MLAEVEPLVCLGYRHFLRLPLSIKRYFKCHSSLEVRQFETIPEKKLVCPLSLNAFLFKGNESLGAFYTFSITFEVEGFVAYEFHFHIVYNPFSHPSAGNSGAVAPVSADKYKIACHKSILGFSAKNDIMYKFERYIL